MGKFLKKLTDPKGSHIRLYATIHNSYAWLVLSPTAKALWIDLRTQIGSTRNGAATTALEVLRHRAWVSRHTVGRARSELIALGFISLTRQGEIFRGKKSCNLYRFTDLDVYEQTKIGIQAMKADSLFLEYETKQLALEKIYELKTTRIEKKKMAIKRKIKGPLVHAISEDLTLISKKISAVSAHSKRGIV